jgi:hypothetical protein
MFALSLPTHTTRIDVKCVLVARTHTEVHSSTVSANVSLKFKWVELSSHHRANGKVSVDWCSNFWKHETQISTPPYLQTITLKLRYELTDYWKIVVLWIVAPYTLTLTLSDPTSNHSDSMIFLFRSDVGRRPKLFLLCLFALCRSMSDAFPHVVRTLANR